MNKDAEKTPCAEKPAGPFWARAASFAAAAALMLVIVVYPRAIAADGASVPHGALVGLLCGMSVLWIYGLGFVPRSSILRKLFSPIVGWLFAVVFSSWIFLR